MEDNSAAIKIVSWFLLIVSTGAVATCLITSWHLFKRRTLVVALLLSTLVSSMVAGATVSLAATRGLGRSSDIDSEDQLLGLQQALYISEIFHILTLGLGKGALMVLFYMLLSGTGRTGLILKIGGFLALWTVTMIIAVSLECHPAEVWNVASGTCIDVTALWIYFGATNIAIEALLLIIPSIVIYRLNMQLRKRMVVIGCFSIRTLDIIVAAVQLHYVQAFDARSSIPVDLWPWVMCSQVLQTVTIISSCVPYLREFLEAFPSGMFQPAGVGPSGLRYGYRSTRIIGSDSATKQSHELYFIKHSV
ncbi:hypothetical protein BDV23DRAFT_171475 [Aspergillus alliaceus]|uniref:Uncharacterized protein n=1 Tax=Petromyces alliaceus TaxID=209559 RepID=A0A5N6FKK4_PETAA|nr:uncharacterized protein BDW43DRAFT_302977 [Aspergillus alliaceus]KAB8229715.1 hypothetical protein BDW43DRAFT_302977 [Aspergillus alliaceus]KAE8391711.1 hypothetical protein BDV23DRAFT_171475 [Aspergillus alliaceus]